MTDGDTKPGEMSTELKKEGIEESDSKTDDMISEPHPTEELLMMAIAGWRMSLMQPLFYFLTRTFAHYRKGEKYDSAIVFDRLMDLLIGRKDHANHVREVEAYVEMLQSEIKDYLARNEPRK